MLKQSLFFYLFIFFLFHTGLRLRIDFNVQPVWVAVTFSLWPDDACRDGACQRKRRVSNSVQTVAGQRLQRYAEINASYWCSIV